MTKVYGHRGSRTRYPENTMGSFRLALEEGVDGLEIDIRTTADGEIVISHDDNLKRCGGVDLLISQTPFADLALHPVHCPQLFGDRFQNEAFIPKLSDLLQLLAENHALLNIEVKRQSNREYGDIEARTLTMVNEYGLAERVFYSSFDEYILVKLKELDSRVRVALLYDAPLYNAGAHAQTLGCFAIHPSINGATQYRDLQKARARGMACNIWTVNDPETARQLSADGATGIITDLPLEILAALR